MLKIIEGVSHLDHLPEDRKNLIIDYIMQLFKDRDGFFIETIELPDNRGLGMLCDNLYGPQNGDCPVDEKEVVWIKRPPREYTSRCVKRPPRPTNFMTVIAGPHGNDKCLLYTVFGGKITPKEVNDPTVDNVLESTEFWQLHAIAVG